MSRKPKSLNPSKDLLEKSMTTMTRFHGLMEAVATYDALEQSDSMTTQRFWIHFSLTEAMMESFKKVRGAKWLGIPRSTNEG
jgi:hypothetical protein